MKLSASAITLFLRSPRAFYYRYIVGVEAAFPSQDRYDHDLLFGTAWAENVALFYAGNPMLYAAETLEPRIAGWTDTKLLKARLEAFDNLIAEYYRAARPDDGVRTQSEVYLEDENLIGTLDGWNPTTKTVHEIKTTSRAKNLASQVWQVQNSIQCHLYCVLAGAENLVVEFAFKDAPQAIYRAPSVPVSQIQRLAWQTEFVWIAETVESYMWGRMGICNPKGCSLIHRSADSVCPYKPLCAGEVTLPSPLYKQAEPGHIVLTQQEGR